jgi:hypothetical protein
MNRNLVVSDELTAGLTLVNPLSMLLQTNKPSKIFPALADARIVGLSDQVERMATSGFSPAMNHPDPDTLPAHRQSLDEDSKFQPYLPGLQKYHDWRFLLKKFCGVVFLVEEGECLNRH